VHCVSKDLAFDSIDRLTTNFANRSWSETAGDVSTADLRRISRFITSNHGADWEPILWRI